MNVTANPWVIDAVDVTGLAANSGLGNNPGDVITISGAFYKVVWKGPAKILQVELVNYVADTDTAQIFRYNGIDFAFLNGASDLQTVRTGFPGWTGDGLLIKNNGITNGEVKIYHA